MAKVCATSGTVHAVRMSDDGKTADLTIHHGEPVGPTKANPFPHQPQTQHTVAAKHAASFPVGRSVKMTLSTAEPDADDQETTDTPSSSIGKGYAMGATRGS